LKNTDVNVGKGSERFSELLDFFWIGFDFLAFFVLGTAFLLDMEA